ncbi:hypothetical protein D0436_24575 (plasmid) [Shewanella decolorationis]|uniref:Uncharacterized protein n=1 Tax=Shewanella decolorationis TaxID=256839 RepID=A0A5B8R432_9GAMM|nr:hypothetical protein [Shewanella decolorationis]QWY79360.1 hypothetical protein D0436_24575 [Shewanella decolorationis]
MCLSFKKITILLVLSFTGACASKQPESYSSQTTKFGANLILVANENEFLRLWSRPEAPTITKLSKVPVGSEFSGVILYWGGGKDAKGNCNIEMKTKVMSGSKVLAQGGSLPLCKNHAPPSLNALALGDTLISLKAAGQPINMVVHVEIIDRINNETLNVSAPIEVVAQ